MKTRQTEFINPLSDTDPDDFETLILTIEEIDEHTHHYVIENKDTGETERFTEKKDLVKKYDLAKAAIKMAVANAII